MTTPRHLQPNQRVFDMASAFLWLEADCRRVTFYRLRPLVIVDFFSAGCPVSVEAPTLLEAVAQAAKVTPL